MQVAVGMLEATALEIRPVGQELAIAAAHVKAKHAFAYADAFAAALAQGADAILVTGDPDLMRLGGVLNRRRIPRRAVAQ